jgi:hypothetical protein
MREVPLYGYNACKRMLEEDLRIPFVAHRDKSREWGRLEAKVEPLLTLGNSGRRVRPEESLRGPEVGRGIRRPLVVGCWPLSSECGTDKTVKARFWPLLSLQSF